MPRIQKSPQHRDESHFHTNARVVPQERFPDHVDLSCDLKYSLGNGNSCNSQDPHIVTRINPLTQLDHFYDSYHPPSNDDIAAWPSFGDTQVESLPQFFLIEPSLATMSLAYENRGFAEYPQSTIMDDPTSHDHEHMHHQQSYSSPQVDMSNVDYTQLDSALELQMSEVPQQKDEEEEAGSPRAIALQKPVRDIVKDEDGRFVCTWNGCTEELRTFTRKCEWNKHMDKHDRPYKCTMIGCEKIPGFTYSGGLLRHQREVHNLHGGPRRQLNCPHPNCKRHSGKGFSRQENLNEHLRRVHTIALITDGEVQQTSEETEDEPQAARPKKRKFSEEQLQQQLQLQQQPQQQLQQQLQQQPQQQTLQHLQSADNQQDNMAQILHENESLRNQVEIQGRQIAELMRQLTAVQQALLNPQQLAQALSQAP